MQRKGYPISSFSDTFLIHCPNSQDDGACQEKDILMHRRAARIARTMEYACAWIMVCLPAAAVAEAAAEVTAAAAGVMVVAAAAEQQAAVC